MSLWSFPDIESSQSYVITLPMFAKRTKGRRVVYEHRNGEFIRLSRLFTMRAQAERERNKLEATLTYKKVSLGVGVVKGFGPLRKYDTVDQPRVSTAKLLTIGHLQYEMACDLVLKRINLTRFFRLAGDPWPFLRNRCR
jgi:hypothetical protein